MKQNLVHPLFAFLLSFVCCKQPSRVRSYNLISVDMLHAVAINFIEAFSKWELAVEETELQRLNR